MYMSIVLAARHIVVLSFQSVPCGGTVENILTSLFSSLRSTLSTQLSTAVTSFVFKPGSSMSSGLSPLSLLPHLWSSQLSSQVVLLATQLGLDAALTAALKETGKGDSSLLSKVSVEMDRLMAVAVKMLRGEQQPATENEGVETEKNSDIAPRVSVCAADKVLPTAASVPVTADQASRLQRVLLILHSHHQRAADLSQQHREGDGGSDPLTSFLWQSKLHWAWSSEGLCTMNTLGARLLYGYHYTGSSTSRLVLTPSTEKALVFLLQAVHQGQNSILTGPEVCTCIYCTCNCIWEICSLIIVGEHSKEFL